MPGKRPRSRLTGPTTRAQAIEAGLNDRQLRHPAVARLSRDTYLPKTLADAPLGRLAAVLLTAPPGSVASHRSAALLWNVEVPMQDRTDRRVDVTVPRASRAESRADRRVHRADLLPDEVTRRRTVPVTTAARTWRDLAAVLDHGPLLAVTDQLLAGGCSATELQEQLDRRPTGRGSARARVVLPLGNRRRSHRWSRSSAG